jgi:hypothetical protein
VTEDAFDRAVGRHSRADARHGFRIHAYVYVVVNLFLALVWALTSDGFTVIPWFLFALGGWGIGLVAHYAAVRARPAP